MPLVEYHRGITAEIHDTIRAKHAAPSPVHRFHTALFDGRLERAADFCPALRAALGLEPHAAADRGQTRTTRRGRPWSDRIGPARSGSAS